MLACKTFIGRRLDLEHYKDVAMSRTIEVYDAEDEVYDLGDLPITFEFFAKPHGTSLESFELAASTDNSIVFEDEVLNYRKGYYYHECYQMTTDSPSLKILLFYGVSEII